MRIKKQSFLKIIFAGISIFLFASLSNGQTKKQHMNQSKNPILTDSECPGNWEIFPKKLVAGDTTRLEIRYVQGETELDPGANHVLNLEAISVKSLFHCKISEDYDIVPYKGKLPKVDIEQIAYSGVGYRTMKISFPEGLKAGESFTLLFGNKDASGRITAIINPFPFNLGLPTYTDFGDGERYDWVDNGWFENIPKCEIVAADPSAIRLFGPTLVETNQNFDLKISVTDAFDCLPEPLYNGKIYLEKDIEIKNLPSILQMSYSDGSHLTIKDLIIDKEGIYRIKAKLEGQDRFFKSNPIIVRSNVDEPIYWGNIHNHGPYSECFGEDMNFFYEFARDVSGMDFVAMSDHIYLIPTSEYTWQARLYKWRTGKPITFIEAWENTINVANNFNDESNFVTLIGYEWSSTEAGHYNIYVENPSIEKMDEIFVPRNCPYQHVYRKLLQQHDALFIPHLHSGIFPWRTFEDKTLNSEGRLLTPVVEVYSDWGAAVEPFAGKNEPTNKFGGIRSSLAKGVLWAWEQGYKFGTIADADSHTGLPGRRVVGGVSPLHDHPAGLTAVKTNNFSRRGIMNGYHDIKTYGTTGERIFLEVKANDKTMGETMETDSSFNFEVTASGTGVIDNVKLFRGLELLGEYLGNEQKDISFSFSCDAPAEKEKAYIIQLTQKDGNMAWSTPIWIRKKSVPELKWEITNNKLKLKNTGNEIATNVEVWFDKNEYPFTASPILGNEPTDIEEYGFVFSDVRNNQNIILHYRWHGEPLKGTMSVHGIDEIEFEYNRGFLFNGSYIKQSDDNKYDFLINKYNLPNTGDGYDNFAKVLAVGFDVIAKVSPDKKSAIEFNFEKKVTNSVNEKYIINDKLIVPLNGRKSDRMYDLQIIDQLAPGQSISFPVKKGYWSVDPENKVFEKDESNNLQVTVW